MLSMLSISDIRPGFDFIYLAQDCGHVVRRKAVRR